jgi:hypothetical protein
VTSPGEPLTDAHRSFLADNTQVYLVVRRADGAPMGYPMVGRWADGGLEFSTYRKSAKVRFIERDEKVCCLVVPRDRAQDRRVLAAWGPAAIADASRERWRRAAEASGVDGSVGIDVPEEVRRKVSSRLEAQKRVILRVDVDRAAFVGPADG